MSTLIRKLQDMSRNRCFLLSEVEKIVRFTFTSHKCWRWWHQNLRHFWYIYISYQMYANWYPPLLINFLIFFQPRHSYSNSPSINYWGKYTIETNFLKQYTCADLFVISQKEWPICSGFCFVSLCEEASTLCFALKVSIKKPAYC